MSTLSEQEQLNPRDPRYYAPRALREKAGSRPMKEAAPGTPFSPASFDSQLEGAVSNALRHPLDPEVMQEPGYPNELDSRRALRSVTVRFAAAVGVSALVALFFVVAVPASRQADDASGPTGIVQSIKTALFQSSETNAAPPAPATAPATTPAATGSEFKSLLATAQANAQAPKGQSDQMLKQFMQWGQKPAPTAP